MLGPFAASARHEESFRRSIATVFNPTANTGRSPSEEKLTGLRLPAIRAAATLALILLGSMHATGGGEPAPTGPAINDYPTATRADYVIGCMAANGNTREALLKCSCAIDTIAGLVPYPHYEEAETALSLQLGGGVGGRVGLFRDPPQIKAVIEELRRAQAEANLQCR
jgi:hypothetical protein